ncbi:antigen peptide transporter 2-like isoform X3 [Corythoichthys intestinalis]|uniref:antigen peptide transporter 2-like isoform X3 n=1 Tax=Corythoichthys intestinalis TaxID=161448 RepID=UPI0025A59E9B|nr:antigen peptide transporter 2-like isoform X3 [Corythoichthys intestinalis]
MSWFILCVLPLLLLDALFTRTLWRLPLALARLFREAPSGRDGEPRLNPDRPLAGLLRRRVDAAAAGRGDGPAPTRKDGLGFPLDDGMAGGRLRGQVSGGVRRGATKPAAARVTRHVARSCVFSGLRSACAKISHARLNKRLKVALFRSFLAQEVHFFHENDSGSLSSRLHADVDRMGLTVALNANAVTRSSLKAVLMLAAMWRLSCPLAALACVEIPLMAALQRRQVGYEKECKEQTQDAMARLQKLCHQSLGGIRIVRSFGGQRDEVQRFRGELERLRDIGTRAARRKAVLVILRKLGGLCAKTATLLAARRLVADGRLSVGTLLTFLLFRKPVSHCLKEIFVCCGDTLATVGVVSKVFSYLDRSPRRRPEGDLAPDELRGSVEFRNVTFAYPSAGGDKPALKDVSLVLEAGKVTALVGPSGSGKTSCVALLKRLYEHQRGDILLDGRPLHSYQNAYLQRQVVSVSQNPVLLRGSLRYNVEYGPEALDFRRVREVALRIEAYDLLAKLEADYDADTERGAASVCLSEGEKQSLALVRALARRPRVLLLDEATSQMDVHAQHAVLEEVAGRGGTVLLVAHRPGGAERAHRVIFLEDGVVTEEGTHEELMARRGRYHALRETLQHQSS